MESRKETTKLQELYQAADNFQKYEGKNNQCHAFVKLYKGIVTQLKEKSIEKENESQHEKILKGLIVFELEFISAENWLRMTITNSLYPLLKTILKINSKNEISDIDKLIYLSAARKHLAEDLSDQYFTNKSFWQNKEVLLKEIDVVLILIINKLMSKLTSLAEGPPSLEKLQKSFLEIPNDYTKDLSSRSFLSWVWSSSDRQEQCAFIRWIDKTFACYRTQKEGDREKLYDLISAALVHLAMQVNNAQYVRSANGHSDFYGKILDALNVFYLHDIDPVKKNNWLTQLIHHLENLKINTDDEKNAIKKLTDDIRVNIKTVASEPRKNNSSGERAVTFIEKKGYQYLVERGSDVARETSGVGVIGVGIFAGGPVGGLVGVMANNIIIQPLFKLLVDRFLIRCIDTTKIIYQKVASHPTVEGIEALKNVYLQKQENDDEFIQLCNLIKAVLELPSHLLSEKIKAKIQNTEKFSVAKNKK